jgi:hypothetical protein
LETWAKNDKNFTNKKSTPVSEMNQTVMEKMKQYD